MEHAILPATTAQNHLLALAKTVTEACPDLRDRVRAHAMALLHQHGITGLTPEQVYWHRFADAASSPRTFSGWAHYQRPVESLNLTQLVMHRFNANDQDAPDDLDLMTGFYTADAHAPRYDERNEVRLLPSDVLKWLWKIDFKADFLKTVEAFWSHHSDDFRLLAKAHFIGQALEAREANALSDADLGFLLDALAGGANASLTLTHLDQSSNPPAHARVYLLQIGGYLSSDILCVENLAGEQFVWEPGEVNSVQKFSCIQAMHWWLLMRNKDAESRARFMLHFPLSTYLPSSRGSGLNAVIDLLYSTWGKQDPHLFHHPEQRLTTDAFTYLAKQAQTRMPADANLSLRSNSEQREKMWISYLGAFNKVFGPMAAVDWPVALAVVGAGLADMGLNIDQAVHAPNPAERKASVIGAIAAGIDTLFNSFYLWGTWAGETGEGFAIDDNAFTLPEPTTPIEPEPPAAATRLPTVEELPAGPLYVTRNQELAAYESNVLLAAYSPGTEGKWAGIFSLPDGQTYVEIDSAAYAVRYAAELQTWVVVDPDNPFSFYRTVPLRRTPEGDWEIAPRPGLKGGGKFDRLVAWARGRLEPAELAPRTLTRYDLPSNFQEELAEAVLDPENRRLRGYMDLSQPDSGIETAFNERQSQLIGDARAFFSQEQGVPHPTLAPPAADAPVKQTLREIFAKGNGLVIGEAHHGIASKQFLIEQMPRLAKEGVKTLYMEHLLTDAHQADLDTFATTGKMSDALGRYLKYLDIGHKTDPSGRYTFTNVVKAAVDQRIQVRALDCAASYKLEPTLHPTRRQQMMNYYAHQVIASNPPTAKWVALVGNSHTDKYLNVPGVADLEGATSLRAEDVPLGTAGGISEDPGALLPEGSGPAVLLKSDLRLRMPVASAPASAGSVRPPELQLTQAGDYVIVHQGSGLEIIHRSRAGTLVHTPIVEEGRSFYINTPQWPQVNGRRYEGLVGLTAALRLMGLRRIL